MALCFLGISRNGDLSRMAQRPAFGRAAARWVVEDELAGAVIDPRDLRPTLLQHAEALDTIHRQICVLPMRFGTVLRDEMEVRLLLRAQQQDLLEGLRRIDGMCEMGMRITLPESPPARAASSCGATTASSYLRERKAHYQRRDLLGQQSRLTVDYLLEQLQGTCRDWNSLTSSTPGLLRLAFLVERERVKTFRRFLHAAVTKYHGHQWTVLGPWPPYSFV